MGNETIVIFTITYFGQMYILEDAGENRGVEELWGRNGGER